MENDFRQFRKENKGLAWWLAFFVALVYGGRVVHDNLFLDSEIMVLRPEFMRHVWIGSSRFRLAFTNWLFGMSRLSPYVSGFLAAFFMWVSGMALAFGAYKWCGKSRRYRIFLYLFPALFITCPVFAGQYLFILQAFEISFAIVLCILSVICVGRFVYESEPAWLFVSIPCLVWAVSSYQSMAALYVSLVLLSFLLSYMNGQTENAWARGVKHLAVFFVGMLLYGVFSVVIKRVWKIQSEYVFGLVHWGVEDWRVCLNWIWLELVKVLKAKSVFYSWIYLPAMCFFLFQAMWYGWRKKAPIIQYVCFLLAGGLFLASPFFITIAMGFMQPVRSQLVYPVTFACFLAHVTVLPEKEVGLKGGKWLAGLLTVISLTALSRNSVATAQLFQTSWEAYRNDVLTANRMYEDICHVANREDMENCLVIFTGERGAALAGPAVTGELTGLSFYEAEAHTANGVSGRVGSLFLLLGLKIQVMTAEQTDVYRQAIDFMKDAPDWPANGSVKKMEDVVVVRLSESE